MALVMAKQVRLTLARAIAKTNLRRAEAGEKPITMNSLAVQSQQVGQLTRRCEAATG
jgi:hypothetical protein